MSTTVRARRATVRAAQRQGIRELPCWRIGPIAVTETSLGDFDLLAADCGLSIVKGVRDKDLAFRLARTLLREAPAAEWPRLDDPDPQSPLYATPEYIAWRDRVLPVMRRWFALGGAA